MRSAPFIAGIICWLAFVSLDNGFNVDWNANRCLHIGCTDAEKAGSWAWLAGGILVGFAAPAIFMVVFAFRNFGPFLLFLFTLVLMSWVMFSKATSAGDTSVFDPRVLYLVGTFLVFMTGAIIVSIPSKGR